MQFHYDFSNVYIAIIYGFQAQFIKGLKYGISVMWIEFDDISNDCGCGPFIGFQNMVAAFKCAPQKPCEKFDFKSSCPP